jgi:hypothetical protein
VPGVVKDSQKFAATFCREHGLYPGKSRTLLHFSIIFISNHPFCESPASFLKRIFHPKVT